MANYCNTSYVVEGNKDELDCLYQTMERLQNMEQPLVENGFGTTWLGCLIAELGGNIEDYYCKGDWGGLERQGDTVRFATESALWDRRSRSSENSLRFDFILVKLIS